jgi:hypothetical protein
MVGNYSLLDAILVAMETWTIEHRIFVFEIAIPLAMLQRTMDNFSARLQQCLDNNGRHLHDIIFRMNLNFLIFCYSFLNGIIHVLFKSIKICYS